MRTEDFDYKLPGHLIAQQPCDPRDACRLLALARGPHGVCSHMLFRDLPALLRPGDRLVFNDTRVIPARILMRKSNNTAVELFLLECIGGEQCLWKALVKPGRRVAAGTTLHVEANPSVRCRVVEVLPTGERLVQACDRESGVSIESIMESYGHMPLPHYIDRDDAAGDRDSYQTIYARSPGAVAAPTAGLHFTEALMADLKNRGIDFSYLTLHVGIGTFRPVKVENPLDHTMHEERFSLSPQTVAEINGTRVAGGRIIAVGTTVVRVLEHCFAMDSDLLPRNGTTRIFILPPWKFGVVDAMITNFHLPKSTLLMLVSAFAGTDRVLQAYREAVEAQYRFFSYGDAMFIF